MRPIATLMLVIAALGALVGSASGAELRGLSVAPSDVPALRAVPASPGAVRAELSAGLARPLRAEVAAAPAGASAFRTAGGRALTGAVLLDDASTARAVAAASRRRVADGSVRIPVASGRAVGIVTVSGKGASARSSGRQLAGVLRSALTRTGKWTALDQVEAAIRPDGSVSAETAIDAVALAFGPVRGEEAPPGAAEAPRDWTLALGWILPHLDSLPAARRAAVQQAITGRARGRAQTASVSGADTQILPVTPSPELTRLAEDHIAEFELLTGKGFTLGLEIGWVNDPRSSGGALPITVDDRVAMTGAAQHTCHIEISRGGANSASPAFLSNTVAHEVFHCFQFQLAPSGWWYPAGKAWLMEGLAEFAANSVAPVAPALLSDDGGHNYFAEPTTELFRRTYDAGFFWGRLSESGVDVWKIVRPALEASDPAAAFRAAGAGSPAFLETWASSLPRLGSAGAAWTTSAPLAVPPSGAYRTRETPIAGGVQIEQPAFTNQILRLKPDGDRNVVRISLSKGYLRATDGTQDVRIGTGAETYLCLGGKCACDSGQQLTVPEVIAMGGPTRLAVGGGDAGTSATVTAVEMADLCFGTSPEACPTSKPLKMPGTEAAFLAWYEAARREEQGILRALEPIKARWTAADGARDTVTDPSDPASVAKEHRLRLEMYEAHVDAWPYVCRSQELAAQGTKVFLRAKALGYLAQGQRSRVYLAERRYAEVLLEHLTVFNRDWSSPGSNPAAVGPPTAYTP